jgi:hypothetical protein
MRVYCGSVEIVPVHSGKVEHRLSESNSAVRVNDATYEGLYSFLPSAIGPQCGTVRVDLYKEREPYRVAESRVIPTKIIQRL